MKSQGRWVLVAAVICFAVFFSNVAAGAFGAGVFLGDVAEMLVLLVSAVLFVAGVLMLEAAQRRGRN